MMNIKLLQGHLIFQEMDLWLEKARGLAVDAIIFDLEDAVSAEEKAAARGTLATALNQGGYGRRARIVDREGRIGVGPILGRFTGTGLGPAVRRAGAPNEVTYPGPTAGPGYSSPSVTRPHSCSSPSSPTHRWT